MKNVTAPCKTSKVQTFMSSQNKKLIIVSRKFLFGSLVNMKMYCQKRNLLTKDFKLGLWGHNTLEESKRKLVGGLI